MSQLGSPAYSQNRCNPACVDAFVDESADSCNIKRMAVGRWHMRISQRRHLGRILFSELGWMMMSAFGNRSVSWLGIVAALVAPSQSGRRRSRSRTSGQEIA